MAKQTFLSAPEAIEEIRRGRMVIVVDDEDRENEGDLTMAADLVTPEAINFMATHGRGLICLTLSESTVERLRLPMMTADNNSTRGTAFTVSIDARDGITTGISARERAQTCKVAVNPRTQPGDLVIPGHIFPLRARTGGVLVRSGHTEAANDLARMAGRNDSGVICEIMRNDGEMARMPDLEAFAQEHKLGIVRICDLIQYRLQTERLVQRVSQTTISPKGARPDITYTAHLYRTEVEDTQYIALVLGDPDPSKPVLVRAQVASVMRDVFDFNTDPGSVSPGPWLRMIEEEGAGVFLYVINPNADVLTSGFPGAKPSATVDADFPLRNFGLGAQVLADLGLGQVKLLTNNPRRIAGLDGYGIQVVDTVPSRAPATISALRD